MNTNGLVRHENGHPVQRPSAASLAGVPMKDELDAMLQAAEAFVRSGMLPGHIKTPQQALVLMQAGVEMGLPPMKAFSSLYVINQKVGISAHEVGAMLLRGGVQYVVEEHTDKRCVIRFFRSFHEREVEHVQEWTIEDAKRAGCFKNRVWEQYPREMLYARCISSGARIIAPDLIGNRMTAEELRDPFEGDVPAGPERRRQVRGGAARGAEPKVVEVEPVLPEKPRETSDLEDALAAQKSQPEPEIASTKRETTEGRVSQALTTKQKAVMAAVREMEIPEELRKPYFGAVYRVKSVKEMDDKMCAHFLSRVAEWKQEGGAVDEVQAVIEAAECGGQPS
jgi:hypothetical protein